MRLVIYNMYCVVGAKVASGEILGTDFTIANTTD